jgi:hypothetical protein
MQQNRIQALLNELMTADTTALAYVQVRAMIEIAIQVERIADVLEEAHK